MATFGIEISGEFLEIPDGLGIGFDIAGNDFAELNTRQGVKTNDFTLPATTKNKRLLLTGASRVDARLYLKNRVISEGYLQVVERNYKRRTIKIAYYGGNSDWLALIEDKSLRDLDLSAFNHDYSLSNVLSGLTSLNNYCYPVREGGGR